MDEHNFLDRPQDIYNCDETIVDLNLATQKVIVPRCQKNSHSRQVASTEHITIHCSVNADGHALSPMIFFKNSFPGGHYTLDGPDQVLYGKRKSGFMDSELFVKWFEKIFVPQSNASPERTILLLLDGHGHTVPRGRILVNAHLRTILRNMEIYEIL